MRHAPEKIEGWMAHVKNILAVAESTGAIYNVDYNECKDYLNRIVEAAKDGWAEDTYRPWLWARPENIRHDSARDPEKFYNNISYTHPYMHQLGGFVAKIETWLAKGKNANDPVMSDLVQRMKPLVATCDRLVALKGKIKMGRRPSTEVSDADRRDITNTGTCGVCCMNVKRRNDGGLHDHGFTTRWGARDNKCFGVGYQPFELDPKSAIDFAVMLRRVLKIKQSLLRNLPNVTEFANPNSTPQRPLPNYTAADGSTFTRAREYAERQLQWDIKSLTDKIKDFDKKIAAWTLDILPEEKAKKNWKAKCRRCNEALVPWFGDACAECKKIEKAEKDGPQ